MSLTGSHQLNPGSYGATVFPRNEYLFTQSRVIVTYLRLLFFPINQNLVYDYPLFNSFFDLPVLLSFVFLAALFGLGVYFIRSSRFATHDSRPLRLIGFGILWFFITLSVESSIIPLPLLIDEYRVYLPSVGLIISAVTGVFWAFSRFTSHVSRPLVSRSLVVILVLAVGVLSVATHLRNTVWGDNISMWEDTAEKSPMNYRLHYNLGFRYQAQDMYDKALEQYLIALKLNPDYAKIHNNLGIVYQALKRPDKAMEHYLIAIKLRPDFADAHNNLGVICENFNMFDEAVNQFLIALRLKPDLADAHFNLGFVYYKMGQIEKARQELTEGLKIKPEEQRAQQLLKTVNRES